METTTQRPTKTSRKIWTFELFFDDATCKWYVYADGKKSWTIREDEVEEAPEVMKRYFDAWDDDDVKL